MIVTKGSFCVVVAVGDSYIVAYPSTLTMVDV